MPRDTVTVPVEITLEMQKAYFDVIDKNMERVQTDPRFGRFENNRQAYRAMISVAPSSDPEGGARGVQGSIADGQQCNEQSSQNLSPALRAYRSLFEPPESDAYDNLAGALYDIKRHIENGKPTDDVCVRTIERVLDQIDAAYTALRSELSKTPSVPDNVSNLSGVSSAPNHQPHAVSQGWQDIETAPIKPAGEVESYYTFRCLLSDNGGQAYEGFAEYTYKKKMLVWKNASYRACFPTHWMPLPAPPSPAKTGPAPSSVEER